MFCNAKNAVQRKRKSGDGRVTDILMAGRSDINESINDSDKDRLDDSNSCDIGYSETFLAMLKT